MTRFILYEEVEEEGIKKNKFLAELFKFKNGKIACSFNLPVPSVFIFDNLDMFVTIYCNEKVKLYQVPDKESEKKE